MSKKTPHEWIINTLVHIFKNKDQYLGDFTNDKVYTYVLPKFADKYSNTYIDKNNQLINIYWDTLTEGVIKSMRRSLIVSKSAAEFLDIQLNTGNKITKIRKNLQEKLHLEHLTPMSYSIKKINYLKIDNINETTVKECFKYAAVALITKEESKCLDSMKHDGFVKQVDIDELGKLNVPQAEIDEAKTLMSRKNNRDGSLKNNGNGLLRLVHLYNSKVSGEKITFVDENNKQLELNELSKLLIENVFFIKIRMEFIF